MWDLVRPLVEQQLQQAAAGSQLLPDSGVDAAAAAQRPAVAGPMMRPSPSFILERQQAASLVTSNDILNNSDVASSGDVTGNSSDSDDSDLSSDISFVLAENSSLLGKNRVPVVTRL